MKKILFVCVANACRSQMAEAFAKHYGSDRFEFASAGSQPAGEINPRAIQVLEEKGIPVEDQFSKGINDLPYLLWDVVVTMGCQDRCPTVIAKRRLEWDIQNPEGEELIFFRKVRDQIEEKVKTLVETLEAEVLSGRAS